MRNRNLHLCTSNYPLLITIIAQLSTQPLLTLAQAGGACPPMPSPGPRSLAADGTKPTHRNGLRKRNEKRRVGRILCARHPLLLVTTLCFCHLALYVVSYLEQALTSTGMKWTHEVLKC